MTTFSKTFTGIKILSLIPFLKLKENSRWQLQLMADQLNSSHLDIPENDDGKFQKWMVDYSIKEIQHVKMISKYLFDVDTFNSF